MLGGAVVSLLAQQDCIRMQTFQVALSRTWTAPGVQVGMLACVTAAYMPQRY